jgi:hypothetical protein
MLIKISLIVAFLAAIAVGVLGYLEVSKQIPALIDQRDTANTAKHEFMDKLTATNKVLVATKKDLAQTKQDLADAQAERDKAVTTAAAQTKRANDLNDKLTQATQDRDDARAQLAAYTTSGLTADQVAKLNQQYHDSLLAIQAVNDEKVILLRTITRLTNELAQIESPDTDVKLRADLKGKIVVVDPKWDFVILNVGEDQGVLPNGELLVSRDGKLVGKVIVRSVQKDRSVANLVHGWQFGEVLEGDNVSPAHPAPAS